ncbi:HAMP domain-containing sensor histidine kinase [soil metagenome]|nr:HAMP domain-containing histidine kinase [Trueperaceae bacterium]
MSRRRRALPLQWRAAALAIFAISLLSVLASAAAFVVVRQTLQGDLRETLLADARRVAALYQAGTAGSARDVLVGPTGGVIVQLYDPLGALLIASEPHFEAPGAALPRSVVLGARDHGDRAWGGTLAGTEMQVALAPFTYGVVAVAADVGFIGRALARLARTLSVTALVMVLLSGVVGFTVASAIVRPITDLARRASALGPERLGPIAYAGPDDEVGQLAHVLNDLLNRLRQALDGQRAFLAETSHELRTPLTSLQGYLDRAIRHGDPAVGAELRDARRVASTMSRLVTDLLQLSRGQLVDEIDPHLVDLVADVARPIAEELPGVRVEGALGVAVVADPDRLRQLVRNLCTNAVRAAGDAASVLVSVTREGEEVVLSVADSGPGVPPELQHRIFHKFFRGPGGGSGLGLAIAQQIARAHGSDITFASVPGDTRFTVRLPVADLSDDGEG